MESFNERAEQATEMFLARKGYQIIESAWKNAGEAPVDIIAKEGDVIVFVTVKARQGADKGFPSSKLDRKALERFAITWFTAHADCCVDCAFRFDVVALIAFAPSRAMMRHHINCMSAGCCISNPKEE